MNESQGQPRGCLKGFFAARQITRKIENALHLLLCDDQGAGGLKWPKPPSDKKSRQPPYPLPLLENGSYSGG